MQMWPPHWPPQTAAARNAPASDHCNCNVLSRLAVSRERDISAPPILPTDRYCARYKLFVQYTVLLYCIVCYDVTIRLSIQLTNALMPT